MGETLENFSEANLEKLTGLFSALLATEQKEVVTLRVFCEEYRTLIKQNRSAAYYKSTIVALKHLTDHFGSQRSINSITLKDSETFIATLQQKASRGYRVYYRTLKAAFNKAIDWGYIKENPFIKVKLAKRQQVSPSYINKEQLHLICQQIDVDVIRDIVVVGFYTGMRLNELVQLTCRNVNLTTKIITVGDEDFVTKSRKQRQIPICNEAFEVLSKRVPKVHVINNQRSYLFCKSDGFPFTSDYFSKRFKSACKAAAIDKAIHFHSLRHSFASNLAQRGVSLYVIKDLLGHSSISTTEIYAHLNMDSKIEAMKTFNQSH